MFKSLLRYARYTTVTLFARKERALLFRNLNAWYGNTDYLRISFSPTEKKRAMKAAAEWLLTNQQFQKDNGFSTYYIADGHTSSYPETSGYIIDSLFEYAIHCEHPEVYPQLLACADWLVSIQKPSGGWQAGYVAAGKPEVVFNTGQVIRGLLNAYKRSGRDQYLQACIRAGNWLCGIQERDGSWKTHASMNVKRTYDSYVAAPLAQLYKVTGDARYKEAAEKNIRWIIDSQQQKNGWFLNCDNTVQYNHKPILHTIAYTIDGMLETGLILGNREYIQAATLSADKLLKRFRKKRFLKGRFNSEWKGSQHMICTGCAQMSIVWSRLYIHTRDEKYRTEVEHINNMLVFIQDLTKGLNKEVRGALQGSFPLWGRYEPFAFPNWATKYLLDALMLEEKAKY